MNGFLGAALRRRPRFTPEVRPDEAGLTLVELTVVMVVIGVLATVAIPTFLGARQHAQQRAAQANLRHALEAANVAYVDIQDFSQISTAAMSGVEPSLQFTGGPVTGPVAVTDPRRVAVTWGVGAYDGDSTSTGFVAMAEPAGDGTCWYVLQTNDSAPTYGRGAVDASQSCTAADATSAATAPSFPL